MKVNIVDSQYLGEQFELEKKTLEIKSALVYNEAV